jgi:hypothetical protein
VSGWCTRRRCGPDFPGCWSSCGVPRVRLRPRRGPLRQPPEGDSPASRRSVASSSAYGRTRSPQRRFKAIAPSRSLGTSGASCSCRQAARASPDLQTCDTIALPMLRSNAPNSANIGILLRARAARRLARSGTSAFQAHCSRSNKSFRMQASPSRRRGRRTCAANAGAVAGRMAADSEPCSFSICS